MGYEPGVRKRATFSELSGKVFVRTLTGLLAAVLPVTLILAIVLTNRASDALSTSVEEGLSTTGGTFATRLGAWIDSRQDDLELIAPSAASGPALERELRTLDEVRGSYDTIQVLDLDGSLRAASRPGPPLPAAGQDWFAAAAGGERAIGPIERVDDALRWVVAAPMLDSRHDRPPSSPPTWTSPRCISSSAAAKLGRTGDAAVADAQLRKLIALRDGEPSDEAAMIADGTLTRRIDLPSARAAAAGRTGTSARGACVGRDTVTGYAPVRGPGLGGARPPGGGRGVRRGDRPAAGRDPLRRPRALLSVVFAYFVARASDQAAARGRRGGRAGRAGRPDGAGGAGRARPSCRSWAAPSTTWSPRSTGS